MNKIIDIIKNSEEMYADNECFKSTVLPALEHCESEEESLRTLITMIILQSEVFDTLLNNIALLGNKELIEKCNTDVHNIFHPIMED